MARQNIEAPHTKAPEVVCAFYQVNPARGLNEKQVEENREAFGRNELTKEEGKSMLELILEQFEDLLVRILLGAALVSFLLAYFGGEAEHEGLTAYVEPFVILLILVANAVVGIWQESNAEKALDALKSLQPELAHVLRDGRWQTISAGDLVPGDVVQVRVGDKVPADLRLIQLKATSLRMEQSQLTGESASVLKGTEALGVVDCELQAKTNLLFSSTTVSNGAGVGVVVATGMSSEIGKIQEAVEKAGEEDQSTPLQKKLDEFGELLSKVIGVICVVVWIINYKNFWDPMHGTVLRGCIYYFKIAVALAVAAIPEGLPAVITTCLALGTRKMAQKNAIVRRLPSVETLGCTSVICSDKTGTLTTNEMTCVKFFHPTKPGQLALYKVDGHSYAPVGKVLGENEHARKELGSIGAADGGLATLAKVGALCNASQLEIKAGKFCRIGEPTEAAIRVLVEKLGCPDAAANGKFLQQSSRPESEASAFSHYWSKNVKTLATLEFTRDRKSMSVLAREEGAKTNTLYVKGAPESILERCESVVLADGSIGKLSPEFKKQILDQVERMASSALRTLALAVRTDCGDLKDYDGPSHKAHAQLTNPDNFVNIEKNLAFCGVVGLLDPPRPEVRGAIEVCHQAGINVVMITGDNKLTAEAIAESIGILPANLDPKAKAQRSFTGKEFEQMPEDQKRAVLSAKVGLVFSRTEPKHKQTIVKIFKELGEVAAMTGDGVNDAPALKLADIGVAMGIAGTEVAKEASDMVLADDNFSTIVVAVEEGRSIYNNMKAFIRYLISSNIGEVASIFLTAALGVPEGLAPVQLLWVNLVTDGLPATALGFNPPDVGVMSKPPRHQGDGLISGWVFFRYMVIGAYVGFATVGIFVYWYVFGIDPEDGHTLVSFSQLASWGQCHKWEGFTAKTVFGMDPTDPCTYFTTGKIKASTLSLTVLVIIEMFNAYNALSEDGSLLQMPPWANPWLILASSGSILVHMVILYVPFLASIFSVVPLSLHDWSMVFLFSFPVIIIDEILKLIARVFLSGKKARVAVADSSRAKHE